MFLDFIVLLCTINSRWKNQVFLHAYPVSCANISYYKGKLVANTFHVDFKEASVLLSLKLVLSKTGNANVRYIDYCAISNFIQTSEDLLQKWPLMKSDAGCLIPRILVRTGWCLQILPCTEPVKLQKEPDSDFHCPTTMMSLPWCSQSQRALVPRCRWEVPPSGRRWF